MKRLFTLLFLMIFTVAFASAKVTLPSVFSNGMVLQQQSDVAIWGKSTVGPTVQIVTSWDSKTYTAGVATDGTWEINVTTPTAGGPYSITLSDTEILTLSDVLIGEVWLASGQSNMEMRLAGRGASEPVLNSAQAIQNSDNPNIRFFLGDRLSWAQPAENLTGQWQKASPSTSGSFSAIAYFYAKNLHEKLNVPVGILQVAYGGTPIQAWMSKESLQEFSEIQIPSLANVAIADKTTPTGLFNAMINPMVGYGIKGMIWYQGEQNRGEPELYGKLFPKMIKDWRERWDIGEFPFHYVQIAPYGSPSSYVPFIPFLREAQLKTLEKTIHTAMAVIVDKGSPTTNHPPDKEIVAERLAAIAFAKTYGYANQKYSGPVYREISIEGNKAVLSFDYAESGLMFTSGQSANFEIAGSNKVFYPGNAVIKNNTIEVSSNSVASPVAVRYAFKAWVVGDLFNQDGFPASSFRTDNWVDNQSPPSVSNSIAGWEFSAYYPEEVNAIPGAKEATSKDVNLAVASLSRGDESSATSINYGYSFRTKAKAPNNSKQEALLNKDYFLVNIKPSEGYNVSLTKLHYKLRRGQLYGPVSYIWSYKGKGMSDFVDIGDADTLEYTSLGVQKAPLDLSDIPELQEVPSSDGLVFRLLVWGAGSAAATDIAIGRNTSQTDKSLVLSFEGQVSKTLLAGWEFSAYYPAEVNAIPGAKEATVKDESIAVASLSRGDESSRNELNFAYSFKAKSVSPNNTKANALTNKDYFLVNIKPNNGYNLALKKLNYKLRRDNTNGPKKVIWSYKTSAMTDFEDIGLEQSLAFDTYGVLMDPLNLSAIPTLQNISSTDSVIFRLLVWEAGATGSANIAIGRVANADDKSLVLSFEGESLRTLPVELINFTAKNNQSSVTLKWQTLSEQNNAKFEILRSQNGVDFIALGNKLGKGNSSTIENYTFTDYSPLAGISYYKLKQIDFNGNYKFYDPIAVKNIVSVSEMNAYVSNNQLILTSIEESKNVGEISIIDLSGRKYFKESVALAKGLNRYETSVSFLIPGFYIVNVKTLNGNKTFKFIK